MKISCDECTMQHSTACADCVVTYLLREAAGPLELGGDEAEALGQMASVGLLPPLRLVRREGTCRMIPSGASTSVEGRAVLAD